MTTNNPPKETSQPKDAPTTAPPPKEASNFRNVDNRVNLPEKPEIITISDRDDRPKGKKATRMDPKNYHLWSGGTKKPISKKPPDDDDDNKSSS